MEECATCLCGNQTWEIFNNRIVCTKCLVPIFLPSDLDYNSLIHFVNSIRKEEKCKNE